MELLSHMANNLDTLFSALSDPTRRHVVERVLREPAPVSALHAEHDMALPTFMRHLKVLEDSGLVISEKKGRVRTVAINPDGLRAVDTWMEAHRRLWDTRLDRLSSLAERMKRTTS